MAKFTGKGGKFQVSTSASPPTWVDVAQVREISSVTITAEELDVTTLDANVSGLPSDYKDFIPGFKDPGEMSVTVIFDPNIPSHGTLPFGLYKLFETGQTVAARVVYPTSPINYMLVDGFFRDWETPVINATDPIESTFVFRVRQKPILSTT